MNEAVTFSGEAMIVMTRAEYDALVEDIGDAAIADYAHSLNPDAPGMPSELVIASLDGTLHPLAAWRLSVGMTETELSAKSGVAEATILEIENRTTDARISVLKALAAALKLGVEDIID